MKEKHGRYEGEARTGVWGFLEASFGNALCERRDSFFFVIAGKSLYEPENLHNTCN